MSDDAYFARLSTALRGAEIHQPCLVVDLERLNGNIASIRADLAPGLPLRIVDKSLPCLALLAHIAERMGSTRFMSFHLPISLAVLDRFPAADVLLGKPMPAGGARHVLRRQPRANTSRIVWLIDTDERLAAYGAIADELGLDVRFCFEIDVGLHRGGYPNPKALARGLSLLATYPRLRCEGVMGYEAHIGHVPAWLGGPEGALKKAQRLFGKFAMRLGAEQRSILNTGGSSTTLLYGRTMAGNEVSMGSAFVMPTDFDVPSLAGLAHAAHVATPILKIVDPQSPGLDRATAILKRLGRYPRRGAFIYGGRWFAKPVHPAGLKADAHMWYSTNQQFLSLPDDSPARVDDYAFLRPTQSEFVLQQFGAIAAYDGEAIVDRWPVLAPS